MTDQPEFDRLQQTCSTLLLQSIMEARKTELCMQQLSLPVSPAAARRFCSQRRAEMDAYEKYLLASMHLMESLQQRSLIIH